MSTAVNALADVVAFGIVLPVAVSTSAQALSFGTSVTTVDAVTPFEMTQ